VAESADVSRDTAQAVLHVAEDADLLERDSPQTHWFYPAMGVVFQFDEDDDQLRRLFRDVLAEVRD